jgi:hypothetical protein
VFLGFMRNAVVVWLACWRAHAAGRYLGKGFKELCRRLAQCRCAEAQECMRTVCADMCAIDYIAVDEQGLL